MTPHDVQDDSFVKLSVVKWVSGSRAASGEHESWELCWPKLCGTDNKPVAKQHPPLNPTLREGVGCSRCRWTCGARGQRADPRRARLRRRTELRHGFEEAGWRWA